jgi:hypothetical protein
MSKRTRRSGRGIAEIVADYERSGLTRREYSAEVGIAVSTLDAWRRREAGAGGQRWVPVEVAPAMGRSGAGFALVLANGRRIEAEWGFAAEELAKLVRVAEG